jgi:hypothetical protein
MNPLTAQTQLESYTYPVLKIIVSLVILVLLVLRNKIFSIPGKGIRVIVAVICAVIGIILIYCIYISFYEITLVKERRTNIETAMTPYNTKLYDVEYIISLIQQSDIIDIELLENGKLIRIGASADSFNAASSLTDKKYYYDSIELSSLIELKTILKLHGVEMVEVVSIDGLSP